MQLETPNLSYIKQLADGDSEFEANLISILKRELVQIQCLSKWKASLSKLA